MFVSSQVVIKLIQLFKLTDCLFLLRVIHLIDKLTLGSPWVCQTKLYLKEKVKRHGTIYIGWIFKNLNRSL